MAAEVPAKQFTVFSAAGTYILISHLPYLLLSSKLSYFGTFALLWTSQFVFWAIWRVILWPKCFSPLRKIPGPRSRSWWNGQFSTLHAKHYELPMAEWTNTISNDGLIRYLGTFNSECILITSPEALNEVLTTKCYDFFKPEVIKNRLAPVGGTGILLVEGDEHKFQRKNLTPAFAFRKVKDLYPVFWDKSREAVKRMSEHIDAVENTFEPGSKDSKQCTGRTKEAVILEVDSWANRVSLDIIFLAVMGKDLGSIKDPDTPLSHTYRTAFKRSANRTYEILLLFLPVWLAKIIPLEGREDSNTAANSIRNACRQLIREKAECFEKHKSASLDILSVALETELFTEENLTDQVMTFFAAGHVTTSAALIWAIYILCVHPEMQTKLRKEIRENLPGIDEDTNISSQQIDHMQYLNAICNEVLRCYPPVPFTPRIAVRNTSICGHKIPSGTNVMLSAIAVHKSNKLWANAGEFNPNRWIPSEKNPHSANGGSPSNYSYMPFLHGPRNCIGMGFAKGEFACLLAGWIGRFEFSLADERHMDENRMKRKGTMTARPTDGLLVKVKIVNGW
ncbi:cytochrome P450 monooxygenase-like protein [Leptodontidium sp. MPI-SDFR-AT-0119]|nr:cytochrome P450 monooxygenase-like protein [Leptodontidium sp. MPI-SDFR-AT-0119]